MNYYEQAKNWVQVINEETEPHKLSPEEWEAIQATQEFKDWKAECCKDFKDRQIKAKLELIMNGMNYRELGSYGDDLVPFLAKRLKLEKSSAEDLKPFDKLKDKQLNKNAGR